MKGYFDALIRSSGMPAEPSSGPPVGRPSPVVSDDGIGAAGIEAVHQTMATETRGTDGPSPGPAAVPPQAPHALKPSSAGNAASPGVQSLRESPTATVTRLAGQEKEGLGQAMVRAAMQWVAAADAQYPPAPARVTSASVRDERNERVVAVPTPEDTHDSFSFQRISIPAVSATPDVAPTHSATTPTPVRASLVADAGTTATALAVEPVRDEIVEISIGAIHVRVDAASIQTATRLSPPAAASRNSPPQPARSALSRRALRRI